MTASSDQRLAGSRGLGPLELRGFRDRDAQIIVLAGELDLAGVGELTLAIEVAEATSARIIVVDLRMLEFLDSSGVLAIVGAGERLRERLLLVRGAPAVHRVFELCGMAEHVGFVEEPPDKDRADAGVSKPTSRFHREPIPSASDPPRGLRRGARRRAGQAVLAGAIRDMRTRPRHEDRSAP